MGRVWLARDGALGRQIALKDLRPDQADNTILCSRFLYEAKITAQLEHPGIVPVYEVGQGRSAVLHDAVREGPHAERGDPRHTTRSGSPARPIRSIWSSLLTFVRRGLPRGSLRAFTRRHPPRPEGAERCPGRFRRGDRA